MLLTVEIKREREERGNKNNLFSILIHFIKMLLNSKINVLSNAGWYDYNLSFRPLTNTEKLQHRHWRSDLCQK